jgi:ATP-dependent DNA helicase UvrD/PcrA
LTLVGESDTEALLQVLDAEQSAAVTAVERVIAVLAGPGSGKTRVLSHRARHLLLHDSTAQALLLTFTNKAAAEMKARAVGVAAVVAGSRIGASTFHTFGMRILRAHGDLIGLNRDFVVLDRQDQEAFAAQVSRAARVPDRLRRCSYLRLRLERVSEGAVAAFGEAYETAKRNQNVLDFDDLIVLAAELLEKRPAVAAAYSLRYRHVLIDEFQDTNAAQFALMQALCRNASTVSVFADDDQAIYRFAGAESRNIRRFVAELEATEYHLTINYRCRQEILKHANELISADPEASGRQMVAAYDGGEVRHRVFANVVEEARSIVGEIEELVGTHGVKASEISILTRASWRVRAVLDELERRGIETTSWLGEAFDPPERRLLGTILAVVRQTLSERQELALCELLGVAVQRERSVDAFLARHESQVGCSELRRLREMAHEKKSVGEIIGQARSVLGAIGSRQDLEDIAAAVEAFEARDPEFTLEHLLSELALGGIGGAPTVGGGVKVASLHRTKGLQWPRVYLVGLEDGTLPDHRAETEGSQSEERRVCFVGVCRAEEFLTLSRVQQYQGYPKKPSVFLEEMGIDYRARN